MSATESQVNPELAGRVQAALARILDGEPVIVVDALDREDEADLVIAAELCSSKWLAFTVRYASGIICIPAAGHILDRLKLPPMQTQL